MAKERYVSFEVAKLLQDKGFPRDPSICNRVYKPDGHLCHLTKHGFEANYVFKDSDVFAPTQQMACDWCQEKDVLITYDLSNPFDSKLVVKVYREDYDLDWVEATTIIRDTLETAINAALEYVLKNLI